MGKQRGQSQPQGLDIFKQMKVDNSGTVEIDKTMKTIEKSKDDESVEAANVGWLFYNDYYLNENRENVFAVAPFEKGEKRDVFMQKHFAAKNEKIIERDFNIYKSAAAFLVPPQSAKRLLPLTIQYPGFVAGTGYTHESSSLGEFKIGMTFDHTTGLPYLPGSSVKGLLRSVFPLRVKAMAAKAKTEKERNKWQKMAEAHEKLIRFYLSEIGIENVETFDVEALELNIFEGDNCDTILKHDAFFDAYFSVEKGHFLEDDTITPHLDKERKPAPLKNPVPLLFLKVKSGVKVHFSFKLHDFVKNETSLLSISKKEQLFMKIIETHGIGAKTNVGYGQFQ
jgi:CRISPR-associated protein Cmr6